MTEKGVILIPEPFPERSLRVVPPHYEIRQGNAERRYREDELIDALQDVCALAITSRERITARVIDNAPALRVIGKSGARPANVAAAAAAVDVFTNEPVPEGDPLVGHSRIVATPHVSAFTTEAIHRETSQVLENIVNVLSNRPVAHMGRDMPGRVAVVKETQT